jgi:hypothetical protein
LFRVVLRLSGTKNLCTFKTKDVKLTALVDLSAEVLLAVVGALLQELGGLGHVGLVRVVEGVRALRVRIARALVALQTRP